MRPYTPYRSPCAVYGVVIDLRAPGPHVSKCGQEQYPRASLS